MRLHIKFFCFLFFILLKWQFFSSAKASTKTCVNKSIRAAFNFFSFSRVSGFFLPPVFFCHRRIPPLLSLPLIRPPRFFLPPPSPHPPRIFSDIKSRLVTFFLPPRGATSSLPDSAFLFTPPIALPPLLKYDSSSSFFKNDVEIQPKNFHFSVKNLLWHPAEGGEKIRGFLVGNTRGGCGICCASFYQSPPHIPPPCTTSLRASYLSFPSQLVCNFKKCVSLIYVKMKYYMTKIRDKTERFFAAIFFFTSAALVLFPCAFLGWLTNLRRQGLRSFMGREKRGKSSILEKTKEDEIFHKYVCSDCGFSISPAKGREKKFFNENFKCLFCGAPRSKFFDENEIKFVQERKKKLIDSEETEKQGENIKKDMHEKKVEEKGDEGKIEKQIDEEKEMGKKNIKEEEEKREEKEEEKKEEKREEKREEKEEEKREEKNKEEKKKEKEEKEKGERNEELQIIKEKKTNGKTPLAESKMQKNKESESSLSKKSNYFSKQTSRKEDAPAALRQTKRKEEFGNDIHIKEEQEIKKEKTKKKTTKGVKKSKEGAMKKEEEKEKNENDEAIQLLNNQ